MLKKVKIKIEGIHCQSCKTMIETAVYSLSGVLRINVDYYDCRAEIEYDESKISQAKIFEKIKELNYRPAEISKGIEFKKTTSKTSPFLIGLLVPLALAVLIGVYFLFAKYGGFEILAALNEQNIGYGLIFAIGLLAGFHCIGMCGGLVVAYSAFAIKKEKKQLVAPHLQYNGGRLISYTLIGGILGGIGRFFGINPVFTGLVMLIAGGLMVLIGLSFIIKTPLLEKLKIKTPDFIAKYLFKQQNSKHAKGPFVIGLLNGFMPCGPLQAMQLYALASGSFSKGALSLAVYALGTIPLMFGFGVFISKISDRFVGKIIKISGVLVIILGLIMISRGFANFGYDFSSRSQEQAGSTVKIENGYQEVRMDLTYFGYDPNILHVKRGIPVRWIINVKQMSGCTNAVRIDEYNIYRDLQYGENIIKFTPDKTGEVKFSCWMKMVWGKFIVTD
ncbi:MAG TPA: hypothetical protein ENN28_00875 [Candidatus Uhrbacteria bacterium]|nr:hypothetical protein [Candidatus Uhrbacteria bacterium]